jgi:hypothetical protein
VQKAGEEDRWAATGSWAGEPGIGHIVAGAAVADKSVVAGEVVGKRRWVAGGNLAGEDDQHTSVAEVGNNCFGIVAAEERHSGQRCSLGIPTWRVRRRTMGRRGRESCGRARVVARKLEQEISGRQ